MIDPDLSFEGLNLQQNANQLKIIDINSEIKRKNESEIKQISINSLMTTIKENIIQLLLKKLNKRFYCLKSKLLQHPLMILIVWNIEIKM